MKPLLEESKAPFRFIPTKAPALTEDARGRPAFVVEGIFGKVDARNENNRRYPRSVWARNLDESSPFMHRLRDRCVLGELEHPESGNTHLERVSHLITNVWIQHLDEAALRKMKVEGRVKPGEYIMGRYEILAPPTKGGILRVLHESKIPVGVSSRGRGDVTSVEGVDVVQDNYDLDTFDAVYMPSVVEARPGPKPTKNEAAGDLGMDMAGGGEGLPPEAPPAPGGVGLPGMELEPGQEGKVDMDSARETIRALEDVVSQAEADLKDLVELLPRGMDVVDQLSTTDDPEAAKLRSQATSLLRVITGRIVDMETGGRKSRPKKKADGGSSGGDDKKSDEEKGGKEKEADDEKKKESRIVEQDYAELASTIAKERTDKNSREAVYKGDIEAALKKTGHRVDDAAVAALGAELRRKGLVVNQDAYEGVQKLGKVTAKALEDIQDGDPVLLEIGALKKGGGEVAEWASKQKEPQMARVVSRGVGGGVFQLVDPAAPQGQFYVSYGSVEAAVESRRVVLESKGEESMKLAEMVKQLAEKNKELESMIATMRDGKGSIPPARYEALKKLCARMLERIKISDRNLAQERARVKASVKLIASLQEKKAPKAPTPDALKTEGKSDALKTEGKNVAPTDESRDVARRLRKPEPKAKVAESSAPPPDDLMSRTVEHIQRKHNAE